METDRAVQEQPDEHLGEAGGGVKQARWINYRIVRGDSLSKLSQRYRVSVHDLAEWNAIADPDHLNPGYMLRIYTTM